MSRLALLAGALSVAAVVVVAAIMFSSTGSSHPAGPLVGTVDALALMHGIPQHGTSLGRADAPLTLRVYTEPQCPYCRQWDTQTFPVVVHDYVRSGKLRVEFRGLAFISSDSLRGLRTLFALSQQNKLFQAESILYANQGTERSGWLSHSFLDRLVAAIPGVDKAKVTRDISGDSVSAEVRKANAQAGAAGVNSTPSVFVGPTGGPLHRIELTSYDPPVTVAAINAAIAAIR